MISEEELNFDDMSDEDFKKAYDKLIATPAQRAAMLIRKYA